MIRGGHHIIVLQRILGHSYIRIVPYYALFVPDHLEEAVLLNPLVSIDGGKMATQDRIRQNKVIN